MANIRTLDMNLVDSLFEMGAGYVLNFSDRTMARFFAEELNVDIDDPAYAREGSSKAKRLRCYLRTVDDASAVRTLKALWAYRESLRQQVRSPETVVNAHGRFLELVNRIEGRATSTTPFGSGQPAQQPIPAFDHHRVAEFRNELLGLVNLQAQARGYAFEKLLVRLFNFYKLEARDPFRLRGEQIDGSFQFGYETYLLEAKWQAEPTGVDDLHVFHGKVEQKAAWTRGLFVSHSGFTENGLAAFGRGKRVICMDGLDLNDALSRQIPLDRVIDHKLRCAAQTGNPFVRVRDLFPG
jgi:hypothetical protein